MTAYYAVDRIESADGTRMAVLIDDEGNELSMDARELPHGTREGTVLRVPLVGSSPDWSAAVVDEQEATSRMADARRRMRHLRRNDPGGDIVL